MKLRNKLKVSFCIMIILPVILCALAVVGVYKLQIASVYEHYDVDSETAFVNLYSPMILMGRMTENIYNEIKQVSEDKPESFNNRDFLDDLDNQLENRLSALTVKRNGMIIYSSCEIQEDELDDMLPEYDKDTNISDVGTYKGGDYQSLIKQIDFEDANGNQYSVYIITSLKQILPQVRTFILQVMFAILIVLVLTSLVLNVWIYRSVIKPVDKLKLATHNIKIGNLDFEMPVVSRDEIGDVCRDFEEMRVILKQSSDDKINSDIEEKELIRNISHDLKTPLTAIKGYVEGILDGIADSPEKREKYLRTIANKVNDMDKLIDELTIYSRLDTNRIPYSFHKINVKDYFDDCCEEIGMELEAQSITLEYRYHATGDMMIVADAEQLKRVINNIISNSVKYMSDRKGVISVDVYDEGDYAHIILADNGKGIGVSELPHIFDRFYRTDSSRNSKQGGSGIGLAIVKKIIEDHKGKIWAESVEGEGTTMHINLLKYSEKTRYCLEDNSSKKKEDKLRRRI